MSYYAHKFNTYKVKHPGNDLLLVVPPIGLVHLVGLSANVTRVLVDRATVLIHHCLAILALLLERVVECVWVHWVYC